MSTTFENPVLEVVRQFEAPVERVFDAWLNKDEREAWIWAESCKCEVTQFEPRGGGHHRLLMNLPDGRTTPVIGALAKLARYVKGETP